MARARSHFATISFTVPPVACGPDGVRYCAAVSLWKTGGALETDLELAWAGQGTYRVTMAGAWHEPPPTSDRVRELTLARIDRWVADRAQASSMRWGRVAA